jgi:hypothetical protein
MELRPVLLGRRHVDHSGRSSDTSARGFLHRRYGWSTVKGPFLLPVPALHAVLSILPPAAAPAADVVVAAVVGPDGRGKIARSRVVPDDAVWLTEPEDAGDDLEDEVERGEGPFQGGEGVEVAIVTDVREVMAAEK